MGTKIEWTEETWNPVTGCTKISPGCKHCYAERLWPKVEGARVKREGGEPRPFTDVWQHHDRLDAPLRWRTPKRVFVNSMSDLFHESVSEGFIADVFAYMAYARQHTFQVLTKRPQRMLELLTSPEWLEDYDSATNMVHDEACEILGGRGEFDPNRRLTTDIRAMDPSLPRPNVWLGVSTEDQETADARIPLLLQTPAAVRFLSCEPLLGPIELTKVPRVDPEHPHPPYYDLRDLNWVIAGGESGPKARPSHPDWFRSLRDQCHAAGVAYFFKQWGEWASLSEVAGPGPHHYFPDGAGVRRVGKKGAGRLLDGREHNEYPTTEVMS